MDYRELDSMIDRLNDQVRSTNPQRGYWKELWKLIREIGASFKHARYAQWEEKEAAWQRYQNICEQARVRGDANRKEMEERQNQMEASQRDWENRKNRSEQTRSGIEGRASGARPLSGIEQAIGDMVLLPLRLIEKVIGAILGLREKTQFEEAREELHHCSEKLKEAWHTFSTHKHELLPADKAHCFQALSNAQERLNDAWAQLKGAQDQFYTAQRAAHEQRQRDWEAKQSDYRERIRANISKLEDKLHNARSALSRQEANLDKLQNDYSSAWNDGYRDRCSGWIDEANGKIADIRASIDRMEGWLDEERAKLR
jgi:chromosome segregation ATPase